MVLINISIDVVVFLHLYSSVVFQTQQLYFEFLKVNFHQTHFCHLSHIEIYLVEGSPKPEVIFQKSYERSMFYLHKRPSPIGHLCKTLQGV